MLRDLKRQKEEVGLKPRVNGRNIVGFYMLRPFAHSVACCWMLLRVVAQSLKPVKLFSHQLTTFLLFRDDRSVTQQCWTRLHSSSNIVGATHARYAWVTKTYGFYSSHDALQVPNLLGVVASVCTPLPTRTQQLPTLLAQQCWIRLHSSSNIVGATHDHYAWITKTYGLYSSRDALQVPNLLGVDASVCTPLPTRTQQCWELLRPFARSLTLI